MKNIKSLLFLCVIFAPFFEGEAKGAEGLLAQANLGSYSSMKLSDPRKNFERYEAEAKRGDAASQYLAGQMCYTGNGVSQSYQCALHWFKKAAAQGDTYSQVSLAKMLYLGQGTEKNLKEAFIWSYVSAVVGGSIEGANMANSIKNETPVEKLTEFLHAAARKRDEMRQLRRNKQSP